MADEIAHLWVIAELVSARSGNSRAPNLLATTQRCGAERQSAHPTDAKGPDANEHSIGQRVERRERNDGTGHHWSHSEGRAESLGLGSISRPARPSQSGRNCAQFGRPLAGGPAVPTATRKRWLSIL